MSSKLPVWAILPAAGSGQRMSADIPKQYLQFQHRSVIEHCLDRLLSHPDIDGAVLALREDDAHWEALAYESGKPLFTTSGGDERHHSVYSALTTLQYRCGNDVIALVHDAVRPLVRHADLDRVIEAARDHSAGALLAVPVADTLKLANDRGAVEQTVSRERLWRAMTPQVFHLQPLLKALESVIQAGAEVTDDASALERQGYHPALVAGSADNIKITHPDDLALAETIWLHQRDQQNNE